MQAIINDYLHEAQENKVQVIGVTPQVVTGQGIGIVATHELKKDEIIMSIPIGAIRSLHTVPQQISMRLSPDMSIHGLLAAEIALHENGSQTWSQIVPTWEDFEKTMPFLWPEELQKLLSTEAKSLLATQKTKSEMDWANFKEGFPQQSQQNYLYAWLLVNTRTFFFETPEMKLYPWYDRLALLPVADLFNHNSIGCQVSLREEGYTIETDRHYDMGEKVYTSYGDHSNEVLLVEYGFLLRENQWDKLCLDDLILPKLSRKQKSILEENGHLGKLMLHPRSEKSDTLFIALRVLYCETFDWQKFTDGEEDACGSLGRAIALLPELLDEYQERITVTKSKLRGVSAGKESQKKLLGQLWEQIERIVEQLSEIQW